MSHYQLSKITHKSKKRIGRGYGSGKGGHTTIRGNKGAKARGKIHPLFAGTKSKKSWLKRLPLWRGKGRLKSKSSVRPVKLETLEKLFPAGGLVTQKTLAKKLKVRNPSISFKILSHGEIKKSLNVRVPCSTAAALRIKKAKGKVFV